MELLMFLGFVLVVLFLIGLGGLIFAQENKKTYLWLMLVPIIIVVIGFGTCVVIMGNL